MSTTRENFAQPTGVDFKESFYRNQADFYPYQSSRVPEEYKGIPQEYPFAERLDPHKNGVPRASYFQLHPDTIGQPITVRVADSLTRTVNSSDREQPGIVDEKSAATFLDWAESSFNEDDWSATSQHICEVMRLGNDDQKKVAQSLMSRLLFTVMSFSNFAPAAKRHEVSTQSGTITVAAGIKCGLDSQRYRDIILWGREFPRTENYDRI